MNISRESRQWMLFAEHLETMRRLLLNSGDYQPQTLPRFGMGGGKITTGMDILYALSAGMYI